MLLVVGVAAVCAFEIVVMRGCVRASAGPAVTKLVSASVAMTIGNTTRTWKKASLKEERHATYTQGCQYIKLSAYLA